MKVRHFSNNLVRGEELAAAIGKRLTEVVGTLGKATNKNWGAIVLIREESEKRKSHRDWETDFKLEVSASGEENKAIIEITNNMIQDPDYMASPTRRGSSDLSLAPGYGGVKVPFRVLQFQIEDLDGFLQPPDISIDETCGEVLIAFSGMKEDWMNIFIALELFKAVRDSLEDSSTETFAFDLKSLDDYSVAVDFWRELMGLKK